MIRRQIEDIVKSEKAREFVRFVCVGIIATVIHYGVYFVLQYYMNANIAYTIGYLLSFIINFFLTSYITFNLKPSWSRLVGLGGAHCVNYLMHMILFNAFLFFGVPRKIAPIPVYAVVVPINFLLVRFVFHKSKK